MTIFLSVYFLNSWIYIYLAQIKLKYMHICRSVFACAKICATAVGPTVQFKCLKKRKQQASFFPSATKKTFCKILNCNLIHLIYIQCSKLILRDYFWFKMGRYPFSEFFSSSYLYHMQNIFSGRKIREIFLLKWLANVNGYIVYALNFIAGSTPPCLFFGSKPAIYYCEAKWRFRIYYWRYFNKGKSLQGKVASIQESVQFHISIFQGIIIETRT